MINISSAGNDYSDEPTELTAEFPMFFDKEKFAMTIEDVDSSCCRPVKTKCKMLAGNVKSCTIQKGNIQCAEGEFKHTCLGIKDYVKKRAEDQKNENLMEVKMEAKLEDMSENTTDEEDSDVEDTDEEEYTSAYEDSKEDKKKSSYSKSKQIRELKKSELIKLVKEINGPQIKQVKNPKCSKKKNVFR